MPINKHELMGGRFSVTNMVEFVQHGLDVIGFGRQVDVIYIDKAFERVDHDWLYPKIRNNQCCTLYNLYTFINPWLDSIIFNKPFSLRTSARSVNLEVNLVSLFFLLFINDILIYFLYSSYLMYADDLKMFGKVSKVWDLINL